jgi:hypothetical protein
MNQAVIAQVLFDLRNGQLRHSLEMGFTQEDIRLLKDPQQISFLLNTPVRWATARVDTDVLRRLQQRAQDSGKEISVIDQMLRLGASSKMISDVFGLNQREVAFRKRVLDLDKKQGRWSEISEQQDHELWRQWDGKVKQYDLDIRDPMDMAKLCMVLARVSQIPMAMIWQAMEKWIEEASHG